MGYKLRDQLYTRVLAHDPTQLQAAATDGTHEVTADCNAETHRVQECANSSGEKESVSDWAQWVRACTPLPPPARRSVENRATGGVAERKPL